jgi:hypothetical protein
MDSLEHKPPGSSSASCYQSSFVGKSGQDQYPRAGRQGLDLATDIDTGTVREIKVENHHVGLLEPDAADGFFGGGGFADYLEVRFCVDQRFEAAAHQFVVIDEYQPCNAFGGLVACVDPSCREIPSL